MNVFQSIILGLVQGLAEFLPISSSGHLNIVRHFMGLDDIPLLFDIFLHVGTLCAVILFFRKKIWELLCVFGRMIIRRPAPSSVKENGRVLELSKEEAVSREKNSRFYILAIILTTFVTGVIGLFTEKIIGDVSQSFVCIGFIITAFLLVFSAVIEKIRNKKIALKGEEQKEGKLPSQMKSPSWFQALLIGLAQGIGTLPGISRSGSTIAGSLLCGVDRKTAGEYSFIASIPAILGAFILELKDLGQAASLISIDCALAGFFAAFTSGYLALTALMKLIRRGKLEWFAAYLIPAGILGLIFLH